jgi:glucose-6-phosphate isomerase
MTLTQPISHLDHYDANVKQALTEMASNRIMARIWEHDHSVWKPDPAEIANRLGWLTIASAMRDSLAEITALVKDAQHAGYNHALLLGMGGSSLAPEMFRKVFGVQTGYLDLSILDSTDPATVLSFAHGLQPATTLFIVATKSGSTVETLSGFKYFYNWLGDALGYDKAGEHFIAITDPGSSLVDVARQYQFRHTFLNDPNIGGRYSALSHFGLVPAALIGVDLPRLLDHAVAMGIAGGPDHLPQDNPAAVLGATLGELANKGRDKLTFVTSPPIASFGDWAEQLIAESTGKEGKGILPVVGEPLGAPGVYSADRVFVHIHLKDDQTSRPELDALAGAGHPVLHIEIADTYNLGGQIVMWEIATAVAGYRLGINPFNQPNVEAAKVLARQMVTSYAQQGALPTEQPLLTAGEISIFTQSKLTASNAENVIKQFLAQAAPGAYIAFQAYTQASPEAGSALQSMRAHLRDNLKLATTLGYGPRFLHSTGQLHKGDAGRGLFIQFTMDDPADTPIPDEAGKSGSSMSFGVLKMAQVLGDAQALRDAGRQVIRLHLGKGGWKALADAL